MQALLLLGFILVTSAFRSISLRQMASQSTRLGAVSILKGSYLSIKPKDTAPPPPDMIPAFIGKEWLDDTVNKIVESYNLEEPANGAFRIAPMGLIRCSLGGKTRALQEIATALKKMLSDTAVIFVSFSDASTIKDVEQKDPLQALLVRIAYATYHDRDTVDFDTFRKGVTVSEDDVLNWLKKTPAILLIDELNGIEVFSDQSNEQLSTPISEFLKKHFLWSAGRYFVFSSHTVDTTGKLVEYMSRNSDRGVVIRQLPLVSSVKDARDVFGRSHRPIFAAADVILNGNIPGFLWLKCWKWKDESIDLRIATDVRIEQCEDSMLVNDESVLLLLESFITGDPDQVMKPLRCLMDTNKNKELIWIPFHMSEVLERFASARGVRISTCMYLEAICLGFRYFHMRRIDSGERWGRLFMITLLIRICTGLFYEEICPYFQSVPVNYSFSYNQHFNTPYKNYGQIVKVEEYLSCIPMTHSGPHIAVYYPNNVAFRTYDIFVCALS